MARSRMAEGFGLTARSHRGAFFQPRLEHDSVFAAEATVREIGWVSLADALELDGGDLTAAAGAGRQRAVARAPSDQEACVPAVMSNVSAMPTVFTIGYEKHRTPDSLIGTLREAGVRRLVDVRELPLSRKRGFSKTPLAAALEDADIEYEHVRALGNPKPYRDLYKAGQVAEGERRYRKHLHNGSYEALIELSEALDEATCLLCFEASHETCHRSVIVEALEERLGDIEVVHLQ